MQMLYLLQTTIIPVIIDLADRTGTGPNNIPDVIRIIDPKDILTNVTITGLIFFLLLIFLPTIADEALDITTRLITAKPAFCEVIPVNGIKKTITPTINRNIPVI